MSLGGEEKVRLVFIKRKSPLEGESIVVDKGVARNVIKKMQSQGYQLANVVYSRYESELVEEVRKASGVVETQHMPAKLAAELPVGLPVKQPAVGRRRRNFLLGFCAGFLAALVCVIVLFLA